MARNNRHLNDCIERLLGPMPVQQFLDLFLPLDGLDARKGRLQSRNAFKDVPLSWTRINDMYAQLVSMGILQLLSCYLIQIAPRSEQANAKTRTLSRLRLRGRRHT